MNDMRSFSILMQCRFFTIRFYNSMNFFNVSNTGTCSKYSCRFLIETHSTVNTEVDDCIDKFDSCPHLLELTAGRLVFWGGALSDESGRKIKILHISTDPAVRASQDANIFEMKIKGVNARWSKLQKTRQFLKTKNSLWWFQWICFLQMIQCDSIASCKWRFLRGNGSPWPDWLHYVW